MTRRAIPGVCAVDSISDRFELILGVFLTDWRGVDFQALVWRVKILGDSERAILY